MLVFTLTKKERKEKLFETKIQVPSSGPQFPLLHSVKPMYH